MRKETRIMFQIGDDTNVNKSGRLVFANHLTATQMQAGLASGTLKRGNFQVSRDNYLEAYVYADGDQSTEPILIQGKYLKVHD
jgi:hypothetical protein